MHEPLRDAAALGVDDLKVAEPQRPPSPEATLALECRRGLLGRRAGVLRLESHRLVVEYPSLLAAPLVVSRDDVVVAAVDTRRREGGETVRFPYSHEFEWTQPFPGDEAETYGWLYVRNARSPLPFLCDLQSLPNVVFVFRDPLAPLACRARRPGSRTPPGLAPAAPPAGRRATGLRLLRARGRSRCRALGAPRLGRDAAADGERRPARRRRGRRGRTGGPLAAFPPSRPG